MAGFAVLVLVFSSTGQALNSSRLGDLIDATVANKRGAPAKADCQDTSKYEKRLNRRSQSDRKKASYQAAVTYLKCRRFQDALWALQRGGLSTAATKLQSKLRQTLKGQDFKVVGNGFGVTNAEFVEFSNGVKAVLKYGDGGWGDSEKYEVFAYELDQILGLYRVPMTILRRCPNGPCTMQLFVQNNGQDGYDFRGAGYRPVRAIPEMGEVFLFDSLSRNVDRHARNSIQSLDGRLVLIDNGRLFNGLFPGGDAQAFRKAQGKIDARLLGRLYSLTAKKWHAKFDKRIGSDEVDILINQIRAFKKAYPLRRAKRPCRSLLKAA